MITHVAIRFQDRIWSLPKPNRHHHVIRLIADETGVTSVDAYLDDQGFLDDQGNYLTREEAFAHAAKAGQLVELMKPENRRNLALLFSEDVW